MAINIGKISPSNVGDRACCPLQLVYDSRYKVEEDLTYAPHRDFGKIVHWHAQAKCGATLDAADKYTEAEVASAKKTPGVPVTTVKFWERVERVATLAVDTLNLLCPLPTGTVWVCEYEAYSKQYLPTRVSRKGKEGFGGKVDFLRSDREILWDLKVTGQDPERAKMVYVLQCLSYHIVTGVPKTGILWVTRDGKCAFYLLIDWTTEKGKEYRRCFEGFLRFVQYQEFDELAWPCVGEACFFCDHKGRCPAYNIPAPINVTGAQQFTEALSGASHDFITQALEFQKSGSMIIDPPPPPLGTAALPPPPPLEQVGTVRMPTSLAAPPVPAVPAASKAADNAMFASMLGVPATTPAPALPPLPPADTPPVPAVLRRVWVIQVVAGTQVPDLMMEEDAVAFYEAGYDGPCRLEADTAWRTPEECGLVVSRRATRQHLATAVSDTPTESFTDESNPFF